MLLSEPKRTGRKPPLAISPHTSCRDLDRTFFGGREALRRIATRYHKTVISQATMFHLVGADLVLKEFHRPYANHAQMYAWRRPPKDIGEYVSRMLFEAVP